MSIRAADVFVPAAYPEHTYVERVEGQEQVLREAIRTPGLIVSIVGPSKSGKTVLVEKVVGHDALITVSGAGIEDVDDVWERVLDWMDVPRSTSEGHTTTGSVEGTASVSGTVGLPLIAKGEVEGAVTVGRARAAEGTAERGRRGATQVVDEIANSDFVLLLDDFHYIPRKVQAEVAKSLKEPVRLGVKVITAAVRHRGDDVVRANPELRGRVHALDLTYWSPRELIQIPLAGFRVLNAVLPDTVYDIFLGEAAGSPQLMQSMCLQACYVLGIHEESFRTRNVDVDRAALQAILEQTSSMTDFRSLVDVLHAGPKTRGTERKTYRFKDGSQGDVYRCVLKALASDPPRLSFPYEDLLRRTAEVCEGEPPLGSSVTTTCVHMAKLARDKFPAERVIDWDDEKQTLDVPDPYLLFYLRWSRRLREA